MKRNETLYTPARLTQINLDLRKISGNDLQCRLTAQKQPRGEVLPTFSAAHSDVKGTSHAINSNDRVKMALGGPVTDEDTFRRILTLTSSHNDKSRAFDSTAWSKNNSNSSTFGNSQSVMAGRRLQQLLSVTDFATFDGNDDFDKMPKLGGNTATEMIAASAIPPNIISEMRLSRQPSDGSEERLPGRYAHMHSHPWKKGVSGKAAGEELSTETVAEQLGETPSDHSKAAGDHKPLVKTPLSVPKTEYATHSEFKPKSQFPISNKFVSSRDRFTLRPSTASRVQPASVKPKVNMSKYVVETVADNGQFSQKLTGPCYKYKPTARSDHSKLWGKILCRRDPEYHAGNDPDISPSTLCASHNVPLEAQANILNSAYTGTSVPEWTQFCDMMKEVDQRREISKAPKPRKKSLMLKERINRSKPFQNNTTKKEAVDEKQPEIRKKVVNTRKTNISEDDSACGIEFYRVPPSSNVSQIENTESIGKSCLLKQKRKECINLQFEVVYPPYLQELEERPGSSGTTSIRFNTPEEEEDGGDTPKDVLLPTEKCRDQKTSRDFLKNLVEVETTEEEDSECSNANQASSQTVHNYSGVVELCDKASCKKDTKEVPREADNPDHTKNCHTKGYELLRRLTRGRFHKNVSLFLASNGRYPAFSPVEVTAVNLPTRSIASKFLKSFRPRVNAAGYTAADNLHAHNSNRNSGECKPHTGPELLPAHKNLLMLLHVFISSTCVYQVTTHCQWPPLSYLLSERPDSPRKKGCSSHGNNSSSRYTRVRAGCKTCVCNVHGSSRAGTEGVGDGEGGGRERFAKGVFARGTCVGATNDTTSASPLRCSGGDSSRCIDELLHEDARKKIFLQICEGLQHLHSYGVRHGDLNCSNILVTDKLQVKLAGYGACWLHTPWESHWLSRDGHYDVYIPPEVMARCSYQRWTRASDVWCLGMTLLHMTMGHVSQKLNSAVRLMHSKQFKTLVIDKVEYQLGRLMKKMFELRPQDRPPVGEVMTHAWLSNGTELADDISRSAQAPSTFRTDGRTFPLPKRIRQACATMNNRSSSTAHGTGDNRYAELRTQWSSHDDEADHMGKNDALEEYLRKRKDKARNKGGKSKNDKRKRNQGDNIRMPTSADEMAKDVECSNSEDRDNSPESLTNDMKYVSYGGEINIDSNNDDIINSDQDENYDERYISDGENDMSNFLPVERPFSPRACNSDINDTDDEKKTIYESETSGKGQNIKESDSAHDMRNRQSATVSESDNHADTYENNIECENCSDTEDGGDETAEVTTNVSGDGGSEDNEYAVICAKKVTFEKQEESPTEHDVSCGVDKDFSFSLFSLSQEGLAMEQT